MAKILKKLMKWGKRAARAAITFVPSMLNAILVLYNSCLFLHDLNGSECLALNRSEETMLSMAEIKESGGNFSMICCNETVDTCFRRIPNTLFDCPKVTPQCITDIKPKFEVFTMIDNGTDEKVEYRKDTIYY